MKREARDLNQEDAHLMARVWNMQGSRVFDYKPFKEEDGTWSVLKVRK